MKCQSMKPGVTLAALKMLGELMQPYPWEVPLVIYLSVHLENGQSVYFSTDNTSGIVQKQSITTFLGSFELCKNDSFSRGLLYSGVPAYFIWKNNKKESVFRPSRSQTCSCVW